MQGHQNEYHFSDSGNVSCTSFDHLILRRHFLWETETTVRVIASCLGVKNVRMSTVWGFGHLFVCFENTLVQASLSVSSLTSVIPVQQGLLVACTSCLLHWQLL